MNKIDNIKYSVYTSNCNNMCLFSDSNNSLGFECESDKEREETDEKDVTPDAETINFTEVNVEMETKEKSSETDEHEEKTEKSTSNENNKSSTDAIKDTTTINVSSGNSGDIKDKEKCVVEDTEKTMDINKTNEKIDNSKSSEKSEDSNSQVGDEKTSTESENTEMKSTENEQKTETNV